MSKGVVLRRVLAVSSVVVLAACAGAPDGGDGTNEDDFARSDTPEDTVLPYSGAWLDVPKALSGVGQFDRLRGTVHDDAKCSTMVAMAAAIVGGRDRFVTFLDAVAKKRTGKKDDLDVVEGVRGAALRKQLTPRHLHDLTDVVVRAYGVAGGAYDGQIANMVRASGYVSVHVGSSKPSVLIDSMEPGDVVPLAIVAENIPHITLLWKDARGVVRLYDSDDIHGSHVLPRGSAGYRMRIEDPQSGWELRDKYH